jgi:4-amino-4-deoxychorismate lyase
VLDNAEDHTLRARDMLTVFRTAESALAAARARVPRWPHDNLLAFYSSALGGIATDPAMMCVPIDDHMVHRGHCVFDTANCIDGRAYGLDFHLDRLYRSAAQARIERPPPLRDVRDAVLATLAVAGERDGVFVRFWLSAGRGDFAVSPSALRAHGAIGADPGAASFYAAVHRCAPKAVDAPGVAEVTVGVPLKPKLLATMKSNNYLINALTAMEAEDAGGALGIQLDADGCVVESSIASIAIVGADGVLKAPPFDHALASTTLIRALELAAKWTTNPPRARAAAGAPPLPLLAGVTQAPVPLAEAYAARELLSLGGGGIVPITALNGRTIGDGRPGPVFRALWAALDDDLRNDALTHEIPYAAYRRAAP